MDSLGLAGVLISLAGLSLLWQARREVLYWLRVYFRILGGEVTRRGGLQGTERPVSPPQDPMADAAPEKRKATTLRLVGGLALMFLGQLLFVLDLAF